MKPWLSLKFTPNVRLPKPVYLATPVIYDLGPEPEDFTTETGSSAQLQDASDM
jgi:hypothetical protein